MNTAVASPINARLVVTLWLRTGDPEPCVLSSQIRQDDVSNRVSFSNLPSLADVFVPTIAQEFIRLWKQAADAGQVFSSADYTFSDGSLFLRGLHILQSARGNGVKQIILRFLEVGGAIGAIFRNSQMLPLPSAQQVSTLAVDTLLNLVNPMLNLLSNVDALKDNPDRLDQVLDTLKQNETEIRDKFDGLAEAVKRLDRESVAELTDEDADAPDTSLVQIQDFRSKASGHQS